jgi:hypothetical protein
MPGVTDGTTGVTQLHQAIGTVAGQVWKGGAGDGEA